MLDLYDLIRQFLETLIIPTQSGYQFAKYNILTDLELLSQIGEAAAALIDPNTEYICALALSGLPIGVAVARILQLPLVFFSRDAWNEDPDIGLHQILSDIPENAKVTIIDTHIKTGHTSARCVDYIRENFKADVIQIVWPFDFECITETVDGVKYSSIAKLSQYEHIVCKLLKVADIETARELYLNEASTFWDYVDAFPPVSTKRYHRIFTLSDLVFPIAQPRALTKSDDFSRELRKYVPIDNIGVWKFFKHPNLLRKTVSEILSYTNLEEYSGIMGLETLGGAFAIYVSLEANFKGKIYLYTTDRGLLPTQPNLDAQNVIMFQVRIETGRHALDAWETIQSLNGKVHKVVSVRTNISKRFFNLRTISLRTLYKHGVELFKMD